jgi:hypothetical protein
VSQLSRTAKYSTASGACWKAALRLLLPLVLLSRENLRTAPVGLAFFAGRCTTDRVGMAAAAVMVACRWCVVVMKCCD